MTLELWSDPENDGELSCCSAQAVRGARALAHELGMAHLSIDLRAEFRAGWSTAGWPTTRGPHAQPLRALQRQRAPRRDARAGRAPRGAGARDRPLRARRRGPGRCCGPPATRAKDQSYVLRALAPRARWRGCASLSGELHKTEVRAIAERAGLPVARRRDSQDLCFLAGTAPGALPAIATAASGGGPGRSSTSRAALGEHAGRHTLHRRPAPRPRHLRLPEPLYVLDDGHGHQHRHRRSAGGAAARARCRCAS